MSLEVPDPENNLSAERRRSQLGALLDDVQHTLKAYKDHYHEYWAKHATSWLIDIKRLRELIETIDDNKPLTFDDEIRTIISELDQAIREYFSS